MIKKILDKLKRKYARIGIILVLLLMVVLVIAFFASKSPGKRGRGMDSDRAVPVMLAEVELGKIRSALFYSGEIHAEEEVKVFSVAAGKIIKYYYKEGDYVSRGSVIATLERQERWDDYMPVTVRAPISGIVARNYLDRGELATETTAISLIVGGRGITVTIKVPDNELPLMKVGMKAELVVPSTPDVAYIGEVSQVSPVLDTTTRTARVELLFKDGITSLIAGMFGDIFIITEEKEGVMIIPAKALMYERQGRDGPYCFMVEGNKAKKRPLTLGIVNEKSAEALSGIKVGEKVVVVGKENLKEDSSIVVTEDY
ncbi:MAG: efflux RND transporter periplasmic adaptor subunit [Deltaproteobacteria bacterium]|uniref:Efflux RND transporter periplasmic adaptor subunit n=1 Tax=Candidatus Zymogenus saltonus TaxID=2844893 RepID=A0A9D8PNV1_9DELT|nr:efflux RND transporter periplasmic adaptor subunit [Candidatus Zymogenus saltonus]